MAEGDFNNAARLGHTRLTKPAERKGRDLLHVTVLTVISVAIGVYLIASSVLISKDGAFYIGEAQKIGHNMLGVAKRNPPAYPLLLFVAHAVTRLFVGSDSTAVWVLSSQAVTLLCRTLALIALYLVGKRLVGPRRSFHAVAILCLLPYAAHDGSDVLREWPVLLVITGGLWLLLWAIRQQRWWAFGLVGLLAGLGYLLHPACAQSALYGVLGVLLVPRNAGWRLRSAGASLALAVGFVLAAAPLLMATGQIAPQQLQQVAADHPAVILSAAGRPASNDPIRISACEGQNLEVAMEVLDADLDDLEFSGVLIPAGSRPVYGFYCPANDACFWTISEHEKDSLLTNYPREVWTYGGIACYAYARANDAAGLRPVYRLWSRVRGRHFYTIDTSQRDAMIAGSSGEQWVNEGVAFRVPAEDRPPADAVPVHRFQIARQEYFWSVARMPPERLKHDVTYDGVAWYAFGGRPLPAGAIFRDGILRWRPSSEQVGEYQLSLIVSNQRFGSCRLVQIDVQKADAGRASLRQAQGRLSHDDSEVSEDARPALHPSSSGSGLVVRPAQSASKDPDGMALRSAEALNAVAGGIAENLMFFFLLPLGIGFVYRWRHEASRQERILMAAVVAVNVTLVFTRYVWVEPTSLRRYSIPMVALTIFYVPVGLELMARWLTKSCGRRLARALSGAASEGFWLYVLTVVGVTICLPKLVRPLGEGKEDYRLVAQWLRGHTRTDATIAVPDRRIAFYADRKGLAYERQVDPRKVDYIVAIMAETGPTGLLRRWDEVYAPPNQKGSSKRFVVFSRPAAQTVDP